MHPEDPVFQLAESLNTHLPLGPGELRIERPAWVVWLGTGVDHPAFTVVQRLRLGDDVAPAVAEVRALLKHHGRARATWEIGPSATPSDLTAKLLALGMTPYEEPTATAMVLRHALPSTETAVRARKAASVDDCVAAFELLNSVFHERNETADDRRARAETLFARQCEGHEAMFLAELDGAVVAAARSLYTPHAVVLGGGATLEHARGRGAYRALVAARHDDAIARATPTLVIQAGAMSRPILERLGFETTATIQVLLDAPA